MMLTSGSPLPLPMLELVRRDVRGQKADVALAPERGAHGMRGALERRLETPWTFQCSSFLGLLMAVSVNLGTP